MKLKYTLILLISPVVSYAQLNDVQQLVPVHDINPNIKIECMYATYRNFTGQQIYPEQFYGKTYLLKEVAEQLSKVQEELEQQGLGLLIWDAFRPLEAQQKLWDCCPDSRFVFPPQKGGKHTRGTTVDLTIIDLATGIPLDMGSGFDVFFERSYSDCSTLSQTVQNNRTLLKQVMEKYGFNQLPKEWWHFDYKTIWEHEPLQVSFEELSSYHN